MIDVLTENGPGFLSLVTIVEVYCGLRRAYTINTARCLELLEGLLDAGELRSVKSPSSELRSPRAPAESTLPMPSSLISGEWPTAITR